MSMSGRKLKQRQARAKRDAFVPPSVKKSLKQGALVQIENQLEILRSKVYDAIPTLDPTKQWDADKAAGEGKYKTGVTTRQSTKKIAKPLVLHPGTDKHPPQVQLITEDVQVGTWKHTFYSGMISPAEKSDDKGSMPYRLFISGVM